MDDTIIIIAFVVSIIGFIAGWHMRAIALIKSMSDNPEHFIKLLEKVKEINDEHDRNMAKLKQGEPIPEGEELFIERVGNMLYAYAKETNQFIAQGPSLDALMNQAQEKFPNRKFFGTIKKDSSAKELV